MSSIHEPLTAAELRASTEVLGALQHVVEPDIDLEPALARAMMVLARALAALLMNLPHEGMATTAVTTFYDSLRLFMTPAEKGN